MMNSRQKEVLERSLNDEEKVLKKLFRTYKQSETEINKKIKALKKDIENLDELASLPISEEEKEILLSRRQSKIYQKQYQEALKKQLNGIVDNMQKAEYKAISDYLTGCYENGFIGAMYDLQGQGIPMCFPLDQQAMVRAVQLDSKISKGLYTHLNENYTALKRKITAEVSRGIATGMSFQKIAKQLSLKMTGTYTNPKGAYAYAVRIARTEGHRIQVQSAMDACNKAKEKGADVLKQWDSALDKRTRESHAIVDGEIRELDKPFSNGLMFPGEPSGPAAEVINCRCALLQRARWALDKDELETLKKRAEYFGLDKTENFEDYKKKYLKAAENVNNPLTNNNTESGIISGKDKLVKTIKSQSWFKEQLSEDEQKDVLRVFDTATENELKFWAAHGEKIKGNLHNGSGYYSPTTKTVHLDISRTDERSKRVGFEKTDLRLFLHETGHLFDYNIMSDGSTVRSHLPDLRKKMRTDVLEYINDIFSKNNLATTKRLSGFSWEQTRVVMQDLREDTHLKNAVSDLFGGISGKQLQGGYGHKKSYWKGDALETEAIAHMFEAKFMKGERLEVFKKYFPNSYNYFAEFIEKGVEQKL